MKNQKSVFPPKLYGRIGSSISVVGSQTVNSGLKASAAPDRAAPAGQRVRQRRRGTRRFLSSAQQQ